MIENSLLGILALLIALRFVGVRRGRGVSSVRGRVVSIWRETVTCLRAAARIKRAKTMLRKTYDEIFVMASAFGHITLTLFVAFVEGLLQLEPSSSDVESRESLLFAYSFLFCPRRKVL